MGVLVAAIIVVVAPWLVNTLLGETYTNSILLLQLSVVAAIP